jgi:hypothetical protein
MSAEDMSVYDEKFYRVHLDDEHQVCMSAIAEALNAEFHPFSVVDFGCGVGSLLERFRVVSHVTVLGYEHPDALAVLRETGTVLPLKFYCPVDLSAKGNGGATSISSLGICIEVAEHIPRECHPQFFDFITTAGDVLFFSGAMPGQGGTGHIAEAPVQYWDRQLAGRGFEYDEETTRRVVSAYRDRVGRLWWYVNCRVYRRVR